MTIILSRLTHMYTLSPTIWVGESTQFWDEVWLCSSSRSEAMEVLENWPRKKADGEYNAWRYAVGQPADTSVTGWVAMAAKSAKVAGLPADQALFEGVRNHLDKVTHPPKGDDPYAPPVVHYLVESNGRSRFSGSCGDSHCLPSIALVCNLFTGRGTDEPVNMGLAARLRKAVPERGKSTNSGHNFYYWYYGTLGMFQMGGDYWREWNQGLKGALLPTQSKGGPNDGSWDPKLCSFGARCGGRVYTTAVGALCLEVYYRYLPMYGK